MSQGHRIPLKQARTLAKKIVCQLSPYCQRIRVAGSLRRHKGTIGDIELVVIPKYHPSLFPDLLGQSRLTLALQDLVEQGRLLKANRGEAFQQFYIPHFQRQGKEFKLEINVSSPERWAVEFAIKTGPVDFSRKLVTTRRKGGFLPSDCSISDGWQVVRAGKIVPLLNECDFIELCCQQWISPQKRC